MFVVQKVSCALILGECLLPAVLIWPARLHWYAVDAYGSCWPSVLAAVMVSYSRTSFYHEVLQMHA